MTVPLLSEADAEIVIVPETVALFAGAVMLVVGGVVSEEPADVVADALADCAEVLPAASYAETV